MALRCLRFARAEGLRDGLQPSSIQALAVQRRYIRERNPDDVNVFGTSWQQDSYKPPHPKFAGVAGYGRATVAAFATFFAVSGVSLSCHAPLIFMYM